MISTFARSYFIILATGLWADLSFGERVTIEYEAEVKTVAGGGLPFGMTVPLGTTVKGYFTYETNTRDIWSNPNDHMRGAFLLSGTWDFRAAFLNRLITGSGTARATTNLFGSPTLTFSDGANHTSAGIMSVDGVSNSEIGLGFSISGQAKDLPTDQLPGNFTFNPPPGGAPHTFSLFDETGSMLLQFRWFRQITLAMISIERTENEVEIIWSSVEGKRYALEFSTNLLNWTLLRNDLIGEAVTTSVRDDLTQRSLDGLLPRRGFYRIRDLESGP